LLAAPNKRLYCASQQIGLIDFRQTSDLRPLMSALPPKADIGEYDWDVRFVPILLQKSAVMDSW
jgi:hypothetical protein